MDKQTNGHRNNRRDTTDQIFWQ